MRGLAIILGFYGLGEVAMQAFGWAFPGSLVGMLLLASALRWGWIKESWVGGTANVIISAMPLFFVPAAAAFLEYTHLFETDGIAVIIASCVSTLIVFGSVGGIAQFFDSQKRRIR